MITTHTFILNGKRVQVDCEPDVRVLTVSELKPSDEITTIEGLAATVNKDLHPMQQAWLDHDVAQCGFCQPGQIMTAVELVQKVRSEGRQINEDDLGGIRNVCRCGTYRASGTRSRRLRPGCDYGGSGWTTRPVRRTCCC